MRYWPTASGPCQREMKISWTRTSSSQTICVAIMELLKMMSPRTRLRSNISAGRQGHMRQIMPRPTIPPTNACPTSAHTPQP